MEFGIELKKFRQGYKFDEIRYDLYNSTPTNVLIDTINVDSHFKGYTFSAFIHDTWSPVKWFSFRPGIRFSKQSYSNQLYIAPRLASKIRVIKNLHIMMAYGVYYQPDNFEKLRSFEGQSLPYSNSSKCMQYNASLNYLVGNTKFTINAYYKDYKRLYDDFRYDVYYRLPLIIDVNFNTQNGESKGIEFQMRQKYGRNNILSVSYSWAKNTIRNDLNQETYRNFDRRHTFIINNTTNLRKNWAISFLSLFYSGEPYTPYDIAFMGKTFDDDYMYFYEPGFKNSSRLPNFHTMDVRFEKKWSFKKFTLNTYLNIVNLFNHKNIFCYFWNTYEHSNGSWYATNNDYSTYIPRFISPGISLTF